MSQRTLACLVLLLCASSCRRPERAPEPPRVLPFTAPALGPAPANGVDDRAVEALIASLAEIAKPDYGLSPTLGGYAFPPVAGSGHTGVELWTDHGLERSPALRRLVEIGPRAVPALIRHIDDAAPTKLEVKHEEFFGSMWYDRELPANAACEVEKVALEAVGLPAGLVIEPLPLAEMRTTGQHTVTVGDACFAVLGMITNRPYSAVRYQPSGCIVVNSAAQEPRLAAAVRRMWSVPDPRAALFERLLVDFHSRGENAGWFQEGAAMRLLYYFPSESIPLIVKRLSERPLLSEESKLVEAVAWCPEPAIRDVLRGIARATAEKSIVIASAPAMAGAADERYLEKLRAMLLSANGGYPYPSIDPQGLLGAIADLFPGRAAEVFRDYLAAGGNESAINLVAFLNGSHMELAPAVLIPLLEDTNDGMGYYPREEVKPAPGTEKPEDVPLRLCDNAFFLISGALGDRDLKPSRTPQEMDARIAVLRRRLTAR